MSGFDILGAGSPTGMGPKPFAADKLFGKGSTVEGIAKGLGEGEESGSFVSNLNEALMEVRELQVASKDQARALASGEPVEVHDLMIAMGKSEVAFNMMLEVRNKLLDAWATLRRSVS